MRDHIFRGKNKRTGKWIEGNLLGDCVIIPKGQEFEIEGGYIIFNDLKACEVIPETIGEYTGWNDKNGKKIFEGDILEFPNCLVEVFWHTHLGCWDCDFLKFTDVENDIDDMSPCHCYRSKIVGNIHDNPERLKGE